MEQTPAEFSLSIQAAAEQCLVQILLAKDAKLEQCIARTVDFAKRKDVWHPDWISVDCLFKVCKVEIPSFAYPSQRVITFSRQSNGNHVGKVYVPDVCERIRVLAQDGQHTVDEKCVTFSYFYTVRNVYI